MSKILQAEDLTKDFSVRDQRGRRRMFRAVDAVNFSIERGNCFGLVGESGSGKTTTGRTVLRLIEPTAGRITFDGVDITKADMAAYRRRMQIIFQNPAGSLDPKYQVGDIVAEGLRANRMCGSRAEYRQRAEELLRQVGLFPEDALRYPGEFSGGQQQRIGIARALAVEPEFIVCDEPVSALDVSFQAQIINLLKRLQQEKGLSYLFISHDMSVVRHMSDRVGIMYRGRLLECGEAEEVIGHPAHPYTRALIDAIPIADPDRSAARTRRPPVYGAEEAVTGCCYASRCPYVTERCRQAQPEAKKIAPDHVCSCHLFE
ncbi:MAG: ABC transporter ATP-binding protein [Lachnospiraceae bacterium]|nr:ABC transporter ATP-binding protein [Lachnospiraceae bacterium]